MARTFGKKVLASRLSKAMNNHVYYGEYSLAFWIELILTHKIVLPKYQRHFVWSLERLKTLMATFRENRFVPPVTIGSFVKPDGSKCNYIIDGQQRLTSILLAYLDLFPDKVSYKAHLQNLANGEEVIDNDGVDPYDNVLEWNFKYLTDRGSSKNDIKRKIAEGNYKSINLGLDAKFFHEHFLGFSYIVPASNATDQQCYYTKIFREINIQGVQLMAIESRRSLYFLNERYEQLFEPSFVAKYHVNLVGEKQQLDFARCLCLMAAYKTLGSEDKVARGYSGKKLEVYIENYIYSVVSSEYEDVFGKFSNIFPNGNFEADVKHLKEDLEQLNFPDEYSSIINMDVYFFGLVYHVLFCHHRIDTTRKVGLKRKLDAQISSFRGEDKHAQVPAQLQYLRKRILKSIEIYNDYLLR